LPGRSSTPSLRAPVLMGERKEGTKRGVNDRVTITMTPAAAIMTIGKVLNQMEYPNVWPLVETCERVAFALGFECDPTKK